MIVAIGISKIRIGLTQVRLNPPVKIDVEDEGKDTNIDCLLSETKLKR